MPSRFAVHLLELQNFPVILNGWREDMMTFLRHAAPKLLLIALWAFVLIQVLHLVNRRIASLQEKRLPHSLRARQVRTVVGVINSVGIFLILSWAILETVPLFGLELGPLLASAGVAGLAIGFGAQSLVHDFINGFYIVLENQYDLGDTVRIAGVKGIVEEMSLRRTVLRDDDGTVHIVPNSEIKLVSNLTRDWSQLTLRVTTAYSEPSDRVIALLKQVGEEVRHDPAFAEDLVSDIQVPGIERVGNGEVEYLMLVKTRPNKQYGVSRELRQRIKQSFHENKIQPAGPGKVYVVDQTAGAPVT